MVGSEIRQHGWKHWILSIPTAFITLKIYDPGSGWKTHQLVPAQDYLISFSVWNQTASTDFAAVLMGICTVSRSFCTFCDSLCTLSCVVHTPTLQACVPLFYLRLTGKVCQRKTCTEIPDHSLFKICINLFSYICNALF